MLSSYFYGVSCFVPIVHCLLLAIVELRMDPERAAEFQQDLLDKEKLKDMTAADGTLPGGTVPTLT